MRRELLLLLALGLPPAAGCGDRDLDPLVAAPATAASATPLPAGSLVLEAEAAAIEAPFLAREAPAASGGRALALPEGAGSKRARGRARLDFTLPAAGEFHLWARVNWRDSCGNSLTIAGDGEEPRDFGHDQVFGSWHWVPAGRAALAAGGHSLVIGEREDGVALDQLLLTPAADFQPSGAYTAAGHRPGRRRFADDFTRSPGRGPGAWVLDEQAWAIDFTFDPNRRPDQYALIGQGAAPARLALVAGPPWFGLSLAASFRPLEPGEAGLVLERDEAGDRALLVTVAVGDEATLRLDGPAGRQAVPLGRRARPGQWHRLRLERWGWTLRVWLDGEPVLVRHDLEPRGGAAGLAAAAGRTAFDDVVLEEIPWRGEDGGEYRLAWQPGPGAQWFRSRSGRRADGAIILGRAGSIAAASERPVGELVLEPAPGAARPRVAPAGLAPAGEEEGRLVWRPAAPAAAPRAVVLEAAGETVGFRRLACRLDRAEPARYSLAFYHFTAALMPDPSDYLDFTPEEYETIRRSPQADRDRREQKQVALLGASPEHNPWIVSGGQWTIEPGGFLRGRGPARLRHAQETAFDLELRLKVRLKAGTAAALELYAAPRPDRAWRLWLTAGEAETDEIGAAEPRLTLPADGEWHALTLATTRAGFRASLDGSEALAGPAPGPRAGEQFSLVVARGGRADFDDLELIVPRRAGADRYFAFDRRETGWWRAGGEWRDHGGTACLRVDRWISLIAPDGEGMLWSKEDFGPDLQVGFNLEEQTEWIGWERPPGHVHHPYDNIRLVLVAAEGEPDSGYRLELNAGRERDTVLYRRGREVARARQDPRSPMRFTAGHSPYRPRRSRISLVKRGGDFRLTVNGQEVLEWSDPAPLPVSRFGLGGRRTRANFAHLELRRPDPLPPGP